MSRKTVQCNSAPPAARTSPTTATIRIRFIRGRRVGYNRTAVGAYEGAPGRTRQQGVHYACPCGALYPARIYASVNAKSDAPLAAELLEGKLNRLRCPACGAAAQADLPVAYHDPDAQLFALVLPEWARAREWEERAALLGRLSEDSSVLVPPYVRDPFVVYG